MAVSHKLRSLFEEENVDFEIMVHSESYTAQEKAAGMHVPGAQLAKVVMAKADDDLAMLVISADRNIDFGKAKEVLGVKRIGLAKEEDFIDLFPDCDLGAMPPFGNLYGIPVWVDEGLAGQENIVFNACSHYEAARIAYKDYERLVKPRVGDFGKHVSECRVAS
ncbi:MAG: YbaK/EbsC family protein [bacterium]|nr:MAG: YbaK/EbsC family protein [bacterium]